MSTEQQTYALEPKQPGDDYRVRIHAPVRDKAGLDLPTDVTFVLDAVEDTSVGREFTAGVDKKGRFYIPSGLRDRYGIEPDDWIDVSVVTE